MAEKSRSEIIDDIEHHIAKGGGVFREWYIGMSASPKKSLFGTHKLKEKGDAWIARRAATEMQAGEVVEYFITSRGTRGSAATNVGNVYVYAYKMKPHTKP